MKITIRQSQKEDMPKVLEYIQELATYEKAPDEMVNTVENLEKDGFGDNKVFDCLVAEVDYVWLLVLHSTIQAIQLGKEEHYIWKTF